MRLLRFILVIITFALIIGGCSQEIKNSANEVTAGEWFAKTGCGDTLTLSFDTENLRAKLTVSPVGEKEVVIDGVFSIDSKSIYISSESLYTTFCFDYEVTKDKLSLVYCGEKLDFSKEKEP